MAPHDQRILLFCGIVVTRDIYKHRDAVYLLLDKFALRRAKSRRDKQQRQRGNHEHGTVVFIHNGFTS